MGFVVGDIDVQSAFRDGAEGIISPEILRQIAPAPDYPVRITHCLDNLEFEGGDRAPNEYFAFQAKLQFPNAAAYDAFEGHSHRSEIMSTIYDRAFEGIDESLGLELDRDFDSPDASDRSFNENTATDLELSIGEVLPEINATYDVEITGVEVPLLSAQIQGCEGPVLYNENGNAIASLETTGAALIPGGGM